MPSLNRRCNLVATAAVALSPMLQAAPPQSLDQSLQPYLKQFGLPTISAAVFQNGVIVAAGKTGTRRAGQNIPVTLDDRFHIGSDSKTFTALLAGQFVQAGSLRWNSTFVDVFPELKSQMNAEFAKITLEQLLSHSSGLTDMPAIIDLVNRSYQQDGNMDEVRYWMLKQIAPKPLAHPRGSKFDYSNLGYTFAGAMLERVGKKTGRTDRGAHHSADGFENRRLRSAIQPR